MEDSWHLVLLGRAKPLRIGVMGQSAARTLRPADARMACLELPPGTPRWVTLELVARTLTVWQPFYAEPLTVEDALEILLVSDRLLETLEYEHDEEVSGAGAGE